MKRKTRLILFALFIILFLLLAPQIIGYSLGYRFDWEKKKFFKTGGLYLKVSNPDAEIFIDSKLKKKTGLFLNAVLIQNLLPRNHEILIKKPGFYSWQKTLEIKEKQVTKADNILLIKENPAFAALADKISDFSLSPNGKTGLIQKVSEPGYFILNLGNNSSRPEPQPLEFFEDADKVFSSSKSPSESFFLKDDTLYLKNRESFAPTKGFKFSPDEKLSVVFNDFEIWVLDIAKPKIEKAFLTRFSEKIEDIFWLNNGYLIFKVGNKIKISEINSRDRINIVEIGNFQNPKIFWNSNNKKLYVLENNTLFASEKLIP